MFLGWQNILKDSSKDNSPNRDCYFARGIFCSTSSIEGWLARVFEDVEAAGFAVYGVDQVVLIDDGVIDGDGVGGVVGWRWWNEVADFFDAWRGVGDSGDIYQAKDADSSVEESCHRGVL